MKEKTNHSFEYLVNRRKFLQLGGLASVSAYLSLKFSDAGLLAKNLSGMLEKPKTNINDALKHTRTKYSLPGLYPGKVVKVTNDEMTNEDKLNIAEIEKSFEKGLTNLTGKDLNESFKLLFEKNDIIGIKVNPVGPGRISTHLELVEIVIEWLKSNGVKSENIIIWDRFDYMLKDAGFTNDRFKGIRIEGLQTMDESAQEGKTDDNSKWLDKDGNHISRNNFDLDCYYWADVEAPQDLGYLNQHVFNNKFSYFGKLITKELTKIINIPVFKNTGNGISMATKNIGYGSICNTGRLHKPLFFDVCTEVLAFPVIRDKLVLNITDGILGQYDGGPDANTKFIYNYNTLFFATDPFALDMVCHNLLLEKRKSMNVKVNEHPIFTDYLRYAEKLRLGITDLSKIELVEMN